METVFISWFEGGEVFRSGLTYQRGAGSIFYFWPGHETYPIYHHADVQQVLRNAVEWAYNPAPAWSDDRRGAERAGRRTLRSAGREGAEAPRARRGRVQMTHRLLLLGTGNIAGHHVEEFAEVPECGIVACADPVPGRASAFAEKHGIATRLRKPRGGDRLGRVRRRRSSATPDGVHMPTTLALIAAGKHVLCEKPLAPSYPDALSMVEAAEGASLVNMVNFTYRNSPALQRRMRLVADRRVGRACAMSARNTCRAGLSGNTGATGGPTRSGCGGCPARTARPASSAMSASTSSISPPTAQAETMASLYADLATFPKAEGDRIGDYRARRQRQRCHHRAAGIRERWRQ